MATGGTEQVGWGQVLAEFAFLLGLVAIAVVWFRRWQGDWPKREDERRSRGWLRFLKSTTDDYERQARNGAMVNFVFCALFALGFSVFLGWTVLQVI
jgi:hypothetical protein